MEPSKQEGAQLLKAGGVHQCWRGERSVSHSSEFEHQKRLASTLTNGVE